MSPAEGRSAFVKAETGIFLPGNEPGPVAPPKPNRAMRRAMLKSFKSQLRRQVRRGNRIMARAENVGIHLDQVRLKAKSESPASMIRPLPGTFA